MAKWIKLVARIAASLPVLIGAGAAHAALPKAPPILPDHFSASSEHDELASLLIEPEQRPVVRVASRFKDSGDKGRPDLFGPPGKPVIGPPGRSGY